MTRIFLVSAVCDGELKTVQFKVANPGTLLRQQSIARTLAVHYFAKQHNNVEVIDIEVESEY